MEVKMCSRKMCQITQSSTYDNNTNTKNPSERRSSILGFQ